MSSAAAVRGAAPSLSSHLSVANDKARPPSLQTLLFTWILYQNKNINSQGCCGGLHPADPSHRAAAARQRPERPVVQRQSHSWAFSQREHPKSSESILPSPPSRCSLQDRPSHHPDRQPPQPWQQGEGRTGEPVAGSEHGGTAGERGEREREGQMRRGTFYSEVGLTVPCICHTKPRQELI